MDKKSWKLDELTTEIVERLLTEIPSDGSDTESECEGEDEDTVAIILRDEVAVSTDITDLHNTLDQAAADEDIEVVSDAGGEEISWYTIYESIGKKEFSEDVGPVLEESIETPTDIVINLITNKIVEKFVYETNLYSTRSMGEITLLPLTVGK